MNSSGFWRRAPKRNGDILSIIFTLFHWVLISSLAACLLIPFILLVKFMVKDKLSPSWHYFIWFILLIRLIIPVSLESPLSVLNLLPGLDNIAQISSAFQVPAQIPIQVSLNKDNVPLSKDDTAAEASSAPTATQASAGSDTGQTTTNQAASQMLPNPSYSFYSFYSLSQAVIVWGNYLKSKMNIALIALFIWLAGAISFGSYILWLNWRLRQRFQAGLQEAQVSEQLMLDECKRILNIQADIPLVIASAIRTPGLFGFFRPALVLPLQLSAKINSQELKHIFLHELTHYQRRDYLVNSLMVLLKIIHWFNPLLWYAFYLMREDCEFACDSRVLSRMESEERLSYGSTIIHLTQIVKLQQAPGIIAIITKKSKMKKRILMIAAFKKPSAKSLTIGSVLLILMAAVMLTTAPNSSAAPVTTGTANNSDSIPPDNYNGGDSKTNQVDTSNVNTTASLLDVYGQNFAGKFNGKLMIVPEPSKIEIGFSLNNLKPDKTTSELAEENKAVGAVNAGASVTDSVFGPAVSATGIVVSQGQILYDDIKDESQAFDVAAFSDQGKLIVGKHTMADLKRSGAKEAVSSGMALIVNGVPQDLSYYLGVNSHTAIGQKADGTVLLLAINGRTKESMGARFQDMQDILLKQGAINAALLDGGSLSTMYFQGNVVNIPPNGEQIVSSAFLVMP